MADDHRRLATCSYTEFRPEMGVPVRCTVGRPRWKLPYQLVGHATLITPVRAMLTLPQDEYTQIYRSRLDAVGVAMIRRELAVVTTACAPGVRIVLLCFERLTKEPGIWCHRNIFAAWWQEQTGEQVPELGAQPDSAAAPSEPAVLF